MPDRRDRPQVIHVATRYLRGGLRGPDPGHRACPTGGRSPPDRRDRLRRRTRSRTAGTRIPHRRAFPRAGTEPTVRCLGLPPPGVAVPPDAASPAGHPPVEGGDPRSCRRAMGGRSRRRAFALDGELRPRVSPLAGLPVPHPGGATRPDHRRVHGGRRRPRAPLHADRSVAAQVPRGPVRCRALPAGTR